MRVVFLTPGVFDKGGVSRYCRYQIEALRSTLGATNVKVLSLLGPTIDGFETPFEVDWHGDKADRVDKITFSAQAARFALSTKPHIVHAAHVNLAPLAFGLKKLTGARTMLNVYGMEIWSGLPKHRRAALASMDLIIADCHFTANFVTTERLHSGEPNVIWDCVDLDRFKPGQCPVEIRAKYRIPDKREHFVIMSLGRLGRDSSYKGYDRLIEAFVRVHREMPQSRLVIAGGGCGLRQLEEMATMHGVRDSVIFAGVVDEVDLANCYRAASVFSLVSDRGPGRGEGLPLTPLEAMACGIPIIVGNQDGSQEAIVDGINGFVVDPFDLATHAETMLLLARSNDVLVRFQLGARRAAEREFGYGRFVEKHRDLYTRITAGGDGG